MKKYSVILALLVLFFSIALLSCSPSLTPKTENTQPPEATATQMPPTSTQPPTATATIAPTATPEGQIFRDDFTDELKEGWTWENENENLWAINKEGWLNIIGGEKLLITSGSQENLLCRSLPEGDYAVSTHINSDPSENFQQVAIYLYQDQKNFITINRGYCDLEFCRTGGNAYYMNYMVNGSSGTYWMTTKDTDVYLKLEQKDKVLSGYYSNKPGEWTRLGRFGNQFAFTKVCIGAGNGASVNKNIVGKFDYFEITRP